MGQKEVAKDNMKQKSDRDKEISFEKESKTITEKSNSSKEKSLKS